MTPFRLEIITPEKTFFDGNTEQIIAAPPLEMSVSLMGMSLIVQRLA